MTNTLENKMGLCLLSDSPNSHMLPFPRDAAWEPVSSLGRKSPHVGFVLIFFSVVL